MNGRDPDVVRRIASTNEIAANKFRGELVKNQAVISYLKDRGIDGATAKRFGIGYAPAGHLDLPVDDDDAIEAGLIVVSDDRGLRDRFRDRVMFPIRSISGSIIGFGGRILKKRDDNDSRPKYLNTGETPAFQKGDNLYGLFECLSDDPNPSSLIVVEGYMDVVMMARHGLTNGVAALGTSLTTRQASRLFAHTDQVIFCFDGDDAGMRAAERAASIAGGAASLGKLVRFAFMPHGHDPDSYLREHGADQFRYMMESESIRLDEFLLEIGERKHPCQDDDVAGLAARYHHSAQIIAKMQPPRNFSQMAYRISMLTSLNIAYGLEPTFMPDSMARVVSGAPMPGANQVSTEPRRTTSQRPPIDHLVNAPMVMSTDTSVVKQGRIDMLIATLRRFPSLIPDLDAANPGLSQWMDDQADHQPAIDVELIPATENDAMKSAKGLWMQIHGEIRMESKRETVAEYMRAVGSPIQ